MHRPGSQMIQSELPLAIEFRCATALAEPAASLGRSDRGASDAVQSAECKHADAQASERQRGCATTGLRAQGCAFGGKRRHRQHEGAIVCKVSQAIRETRTPLRQGALS